jgi:enterochelin esterase family protein
LEVTPATDGQRWHPPVEDVLDPVFGRMGTAPMIVVIPDGACRWGCGQWVDSPVTGNFEQYVLYDVIPHVDGAYRTIADASSRGVFGFSSGGFGSWNLASRNPDVFGAMAVLSADSWLDMTHKFMLYKYLDSIWPDAPDGPVEDNFWAEIVYNYSATYSPNPDNPPHYVDLPMAFPSGELIQEVWDRWLSFDPVVNVHDRVENLRKLRGIMLDAGSNDDYNLHWGHRLLSHHLNQAGIAHEHRENPGNHGGRFAERYQVALQWLSETLTHE